MDRSLERVAVAIIAALLLPAAAFAADAPATWDGLVEVDPKHLDVAYLAPGADFRPYVKLMVDPTQVAFHKDWLRNVNETRDISRRIDDEDAREILEAARTNFADVFGEEFQKAGYEIVTAPGPDVLRVSPAIINLYLNAPDTLTAGRSRTFTANAGEATLAVELRDSRTNALLGRVIDRRETRNSVGLERASRVSNTADFRLLFRSWAGIGVRGLQALKDASPLPEKLEPKQKL